ncbi:MAG: beta-galactosidase, partial [Armatimonadetes bacterium]|nr:beta-galactosidase [Armatimonadota bacterium]
MLDTIAALLLAVTQAGPTPDGWTLKQLGEPWQVAMEPRPDYRRGLIEQTIQVVFPGSTESQPGWFAAAERVVQPPAGHRCELVFRAGDSFTGPTAGYHFLQARLDERVVWEADVAAAPLGGAEVRIELAEALAGRAEATLALGVWDKQRVTNFPVAAWFSGVSLWVDGARRVELTAAAPYRFEPLPPDLPLPAAPPNLAWTPSARIVQPWGDTEHLAVAEAVSWAPRLAHDYGFETIILLPPAAHNAITPAAKHLTPSQFEAGLAEYRRAGFRFVLYSSLMHCGHDPAWQTGRLQREHPEWSQRDSKGNPVTEYGAEWLCPNTGAFDHCLRYTLDLVRRYHADAVMLDNPESLNSTAGLPTCYCDACRQRFRDYVAQRFGPDATRR